MNINEAYKNVYVTNNEKNSIKSYLSYEHTSINLLSDLSPEAYTSLSNSAWLLPTTSEEVKELIEKFVNIYSAMYKESRGRSIRDCVGELNAKCLIRGTSNKRVEQLSGYTPQFLSMSTSEEIARTFSEYGDDALVIFNVQEGVPFLDAEDYRSENRRNEEEIIIAPFARIDRKAFIYKRNGYNYYSVTVGKPILEDISSDELDKMTAEVIEGFPQNIEDIEEYMSSIQQCEIWYRRYESAYDLEDRKFCDAEIEKAEQKKDELYKKVNDFRTKLQRTLKGLCRQKEKDIDKSIKIIENDRKEKAEQRRKQQEAEKLRKERVEAEAKRVSTISEISRKIESEPQIAEKLVGNISDIYNGLLKSEKMYSNIAHKLQIDYSKAVSTTNIPKKIEEAKKNISKIEQQVSRVHVGKGTTLKEATEISRKIVPLLDGISYGNEIMKDCPDIVNIHIEQSDREIKRELYLKVHSMIQYTKVQKLLQDRENIENEKVGFWGRITGKDKLKELRLENNRLKIKEARTDSPQEQETYSVTDMLTDLYNFRETECGGKFSPQMQELYSSMKSVFRPNGEKEFSEEYLKRCAEEKYGYRSSRKFTSNSESKIIWKN